MLYVGTRTNTIHLSNISADLADCSQVFYSGHPFLAAQPRFSGKVMHVTDKPLKNIFEPSIGPLGVDQDSVFCDVVDGHVFQRRNVDLGRIHNVSMAN